MTTESIRVRNLRFARNLKFATSKTLVNFMKKMMFLSKNWYFSVQKALIYYTVNKSHHNSFILIVFSHVANFRYVANFTFLTLQKVQFRFGNPEYKIQKSCQNSKVIIFGQFSYYMLQNNISVCFGMQSSFLFNIDTVFQSIH